MTRIDLLEDVAGEAEVCQRLYQSCRACFHDEVKIDTFSTWETGWLAIRSDPPSIVLLDLTLPDSDKQESIARIADIVALNIPVVVLTGESEEHAKEIRRKCILLGARDFILKSEIRRSPPILCERTYIAFLNWLRDSKPHETRA